jgi:membrane protease YdiL (CAAX protease family)
MIKPPTQDGPRDLLGPDALRQASGAARPAFVLSYCALALALCEYLVLQNRFAELFPGLTRELAPGWLYGSLEQARLAGIAEPGPWWGVLAPQAWWVGGTVLLLVLVPMALCRPAGVALRDCGLRARGLAGKLWVYGAMYACVMACVAWASTQEAFLRLYPFLRPEACPQWGWRVLLLFWALYALQFFAVEFFFRGWLLFTLERDMGASAIAVSVVPYCMIHFHKPLPEALGAIVAGFVLGWLALRTRSIWGGVMLHTAVALSMDSAALLRTLRFPQGW